MPETVNYNVYVKPAPKTNWPLVLFVGLTMCYVHVTKKYIEALKKELEESKRTEGE